jgi:hypothetical protein
VSQKPRLFSGLHTALCFREKIFERNGMTVPSPKGLDMRGDHRETPDYTGIVVIDQRGHNNKDELSNVEEVAALMKYYGLTPKIISSSDTAPLKTHMKDISEADIYIVVHGAGATNQLFLTTRAAVIEIFPFGRRAPMFKHIAAALNLHYIEVVSWLKGSLSDGVCGGHLHTTEFFRKCQDASSMANSLTECDEMTKNSCVIAPINTVEQALLSAYDFIGLNLNIRVERLFSTSDAIKYNDPHDPDNFLWVQDPAKVDPLHYERQYAADHVK